MKVNITADQHRRQRGYEGADLELPASRYVIEDAIQRAHVPEGGSYQLHRFEGWPDFLKGALIVSGDKTLEEVNLLAWKAGQMDEEQLAAYEGAVAMRQNEDIDTPVTVKELINILYNLNSYTFQPGILNDRMLGELCLMGELIADLGTVSDEVFELLSEEKVGEYLRRSEQGEFTDKGYILHDAKDWQEVYDGVYLPEQPDGHNGLISLRLECVNSAPDIDSGVWLELPADEQAMHWALISLGETTFDSCYIAEVKSVLPALEYQLAGDEDIGKLNILAERIKAFPDSGMLAKYKAVLELETCNDLDMELDIARNLDCYDYDPVMLSPETYAEYLFREAGFDTDDSAFSNFDFKDYGERKLQENGLISTAYGLIARNKEPFVQEYTKPEPGMTMQ